MLIYDNSYNMPPATHYHPHQTTTERKGLWGLQWSYNTDHTESDKVSQINTVCVNGRFEWIFQSLGYNLKKYCADRG